MTTVGELIKELEKRPKDQQIVLLDYRMNSHYASGDGTSEGIYNNFNLEEIELGKLDDMEDKFKVTTLTFTNDIDYDSEGNRFEL